MSGSEDSVRVGEAFAEAIVREDWPAAARLFLKASGPGVTAEALAEAFSWAQLAPRLSASWAAQTDVDEDDVPELDPPARWEVWEVEGRDEHEPDAVLSLGKPKPADFDGPSPWVEINFLPDEESVFDDCYRCYLTMVDDGGPSIGGLEVQVIVD